MARDTKAVARWISEGRQFVKIRGKLRMLTEFDVKYMMAQTHEHSVLSDSGHDWKVADHRQTRTCLRCFRSECCPPNWTPWPNGIFSTEDLHYLIELSKKT